MKKKVRYITIEEVRRICEGHLCNECSLYKMDVNLKAYRDCLLDVPDRIPDWMLDEEIEIPNEVFRKAEQMEEKNE